MNALAEPGSVIFNPIYADFKYPDMPAADPELVKERETVSLIAYFVGGCFAVIWTLVFFAFMKG